MTGTIKQKPFNLLYKYEPQKSAIDKLYEYVTIQGRFIVVGVMFVVILAFIYRFPLDKKLNDEINRSNQNSDLIKIYVDGTEQKFKDIQTRTDSTKRFLDLYSLSSISTDETGQIRFYEVFKRINEIKTEFGDDIIVIDYSYITDNELNGTVNLTGYTAKFSRAEEFRERLRLERNIIDEVLINNLGSNKEGVPQFGLIIKIRDKSANG
jgi:hypothetical protein